MPCDDQVVYSPASFCSGKRLLGKSRRRWIDNIKMDFLEIEFGVLDWIGLTQDREYCRAVVNAVMNLRVP
jgi:hypothetical protein